MNEPAKPAGKLSSITAFFPAYNDGGTIASMVVSALMVLRDCAEDYEVVVVNDGSADYTPEVLDELARVHAPRVRVIHHPRNRGYGAALRSGFGAAEKEWLFYTDGDAQYDPRELRLLVAACLENGGEVDVVNGYKISRNDPWHRLVIGRFYHHLVRWMFGFRLRDVDCDFRLIRRSLFDQVALRSDSGAICLEMVKKFQDAGFRFAEVPVHHFHRAFGQSQFFNFPRLWRTAVQLLSLWRDLVWRRDPTVPAKVEAQPPRVQSPRPARTSLRRWLPLLGLWLAAVLIWCALNNRLTPANWNLPLAYNIDALNELATIRAASQGHYFPVLWKTVPTLGAPGQANWNDLPATEDFHYAIFGLLAKLFGLMPAANLALLLANLLSGASFYCACRWLRCRVLWSMAGALLFAFSHYAWYRSLSHLELIYVGHLPMALLCIWWLGAGALRGWDDRRVWIVLGVMAFSGLQNVYYTNILAQLTLFALLACLVRRGASGGGRWRAAGFCAAGFAALVGGFFLGNIDTLSYHWAHGNNPGAIVRNYAGTEIYALKPMEMFLPGFSHRFKPLRAVARYYYELSAILRGDRGEIFSAYLGVMAMAGLIGMAVTAFVRLARRGAGSRPPAGLWQAVWIVCYATVGGLNCLVALWGFDLFRATNRYSIFIVAVSLIFLARALSHATRNWTTVAQWVCAGLLVGVGIYDQAFETSPVTSANIIRQFVTSDRIFTASLEKQLPAGAAVFQLPAVRYPEEPPVEKMTDYEEFRPYLYAETLRFSYGDTKGRGHELWGQETERRLLSGVRSGEPVTAAIVPELRAKGFSCVIVDRNGYADRGEAVIAALQRAGQPLIVQSTLGDFVAFRLSDGHAH